MSETCGGGEGEGADPHEELDRLVEGGDGLLGLFLGAELLHPVGSIPLVLLNASWSRVQSCYLIA